MTIQRQFILPHCTLNLEGISNSVADAVLGSSLDVLLRLECQFGNLKQPLTGGLDLLNSLIQATNQCTQAWMSGVPHRRLKKLNQDQSAVHLLHKEEDGFELTVPTSLLNESTQYAEDPLSVHLTTIQLFDLVEALDQLLADQQTLPNLSLAVRPLSRSEAASGQALQKSASAVLGTVSVAIAATAFYFLPVPKASPPPKDLPSPTTPTDTSNPTAPPSPGSTTPANPDTSNPTASPAPGSTTSPDPAPENSSPSP